MDRFEGLVWLDWWANTSTRLGSVEVSLEVGSGEADWDACGRLIRDEDAEELAFLCSLDPVFVLRFADESTIAVSVQATDDHRRFTLTGYAGPAHRQVTSRLDL